MKDMSSEPTMQRVVLFFFVLGLISILGGMSGISSVNAHVGNSSSVQNGIVVNHFRDRLAEALAIVNGTFMLLIAYGVWKRLRVAWKMGFACFAFAAITGACSIFIDSRTIDQRDSPLAFVSFGVFAVFAVAAYWTYWWYKKRPYFDR